MRNICIENVCTQDYQGIRESTLFFRDALEKHVDLVGKLPDEIFITSSCEMSGLPFKEIQKPLEALIKSIGNTKIKIISQGCLGLFSTSLEFYHREDLNDVLVLFIEAPKDCSQNGLNAVGVGVLEGQDGLEISPCLGSVSLLNKASLSNDDIVVDYSYMLSVSLDLAKQAFSLLAMTKKISALSNSSGGKVVSFDVTAPWSQAISKSVEGAVNRKNPELSWLDSIEKDHQHFMTVKQLKEFQAYQDCLKDAPLIFTGLGVGGRFGILRMVKASDFKSVNFPEKNDVNIDFKDHYDINYDVLVKDTSNLLDNMKANTYCFKKEYRGEDNLYFSWNMDVDYFFSKMNESEEIA